MEFEKLFKSEPGGNKYALDLVKQVHNMNRGVYLDPNIENGNPTDFCIGIAGYPKKHFESPNMESDIQFTKQKIEAGGEYIVTQMLFDNSHYFNYVKLCKEHGIDVPIVPGLKPITKRYQLQSIPRRFYVDLPDDLVKEVEKAKDDQAVKEVGIEWCIQQSRELKEAGAPCLHYYTMGDSATIRRIIEGVL